MPSFQIHRLKENARQQFRQAPHTSGSTSVKPKDYEPGSSHEAPTVYALWATLRDTEDRLQVGDLLESEGGELRIYKYVGFEEAKWVLPEVKTGMDHVALAGGAEKTAVAKS